MTRAPRSEPPGTLFPTALEARPAPPPGPAAHRRRHPRAAGLLAVVVAASLLTSCLTDNQAKTLSQLNDSRTTHGMWSLSANSQAVSKAQAWADHLAAIGYLQHSTLSSGYSVRWCALGENIGFGSSTYDIENAFMSSPDHRANILSSTWNHAGTGVARSGTTVFVVQEFIKTC